MTHYIQIRSFDARDVLVPSVAIVVTGIGVRVSLRRNIRSIVMAPALAVVIWFILVLFMLLNFMLIAVLIIAMSILGRVILICVNVRTTNPNLLFEIKKTFYNLKFLLLLRNAIILRLHICESFRCGSERSTTKVESSIRMRMIAFRVQVQGIGKFYNFD